MPAQGSTASWDAGGGEDAEEDEEEEGELGAPTPEPESGRRAGGLNGSSPGGGGRLAPPEGSAQRPAGKRAKR